MHDGESPGARSSSPVLAMITGLVLIGAAVGGFALWRYARHDHTAPIRDGHGISIRILSPAPGTAFTIDGHNAGVTPVTLTRTPSPQPLVLAATIDGAPVTITVIPDHDQTVELDRADR